MIEIRQATPCDADSIWLMFCDVVQEGNVFLSDESASRDDALKQWFADDINSFVAAENDLVVGAYHIKPNHPCRGDHIANATYMVDKDHRGRGIGRMLADHSLQTAKELGYAAMQFNAVVSTNVTAIELWKQLGFSVVGTIPNGFRDPNLGYVDLFVMYRTV